MIVSRDGLARVTDFGLSYARSSGEASTPAGAGTLPYRSPEQAQRAMTDLKTDMWSWGLSVLAMLRGACTWVEGAAAPEVLEEFVRSGRETGAKRLPSWSTSSAGAFERIHANGGSA